MIIVDTSIWIEFFRGNENIFSPLKGELENQNIIGLECVFGELLQGARNKKENSLIIEYWNTLTKHDEKGLWLEAGMISAEEKYYSKGIGLIDAFLIAARKRFNATLWSLDKKLLLVLSKHEKYDSSFMLN